MSDACPFDIPIATFEAEQSDGDSNHGGIPAEPMGVKVLIRSIADGLEPDARDIETVALMIWTDVRGRSGLGKPERGSREHRRMMALARAAMAGTPGGPAAPVVTRPDHEEAAR